MARASQFNPKLESLRGMAALAVCFTHSLAIYRLDQSAAIWTVPIWRQTFWTACLTLVNAIFNPNAAVALFFVLSGWVLTVSLTARTSSPFKGTLAFYLRRCFRILPMMWCALIFTYLLSKMGHAAPFQQTSDWYAANFEQPTHLGDLLRNLFLVDFKISGVTWTMRIELLGSLALPLLVYFYSRSGWYGRLVLLGALAALPAFTDNDFRFLICFYVGTLLTDKGIILAYAKRPILLVGLGLAICAIVRLIPGFNHHPCIRLLGQTTGAALILLGVLGESADFKVLETGPFRVLGRLSYSLYLLHPAVLGLCAVGAFAIRLYPTVAPTAANVLIFISSVLITVALSFLTYQWIERPGIVLGSRATQFANVPKENEAVPAPGAIFPAAQDVVE